MSKFLVRNRRVWPAGVSAWTLAHRPWLERQRFADDHPALVYGDLVSSVDALVDRRARLDRVLGQVARRDAFPPTVSRLRAFRGVDTITALGIHLEVGDWARVGGARSVAAYVGMIPRLDQSGESSASGAITNHRVALRPQGRGSGGLARRRTAACRPDPPPTPGTRLTPEPPAALRRSRTCRPTRGWTPPAGVAVRRVGCADSRRAA